MDIGTRLHRLLDDMLGQDPRRALIAYRQLADEHLPWLEQRVVALARREAWTFARIGRLLGRSRQAVQQRFQRIQPATPYDPSIPFQRERRMVQQFTSPDRRRARQDDDPIAW